MMSSSEYLLYQKYIKTSARVDYAIVYLSHRKMIQMLYDYNHVAYSASDSVGHRQFWYTHMHDPCAKDNS